MSWYPFLPKGYWCRASRRSRAVSSHRAHGGPAPHWAWPAGSGLLQSEDLQRNHPPSTVNAIKAFIWKLTKVIGSKQMTDDSQYYLCLFAMFNFFSIFEEKFITMQVITSHQCWTTDGQRVLYRTLNMKSRQYSHLVQIYRTLNMKFRQYSHLVQIDRTLNMKSRQYSHLV